MEKKIYIAPAMEITEIEMVKMLAASITNIPVVPGEGGEEILSNRRRGTWGNLWNAE